MLPRPTRVATVLTVVLSLGGCGASLPEAAPVRAGEVAAAGLDGWEYKLDHWVLGMDRIDEASPGEIWFQVLGRKKTKGLFKKPEPFRRISDRDVGGWVALRAPLTGRKLPSGRLYTAKDGSVYFRIDSFDKGPYYNTYFRVGRFELPKGSKPAYLARVDVEIDPDVEVSPDYHHGLFSVGSMLGFDFKRVPPTTAKIEPFIVPAPAR